ncbi:N-acetylmuramoyl-L-alanine amidase [Intestinimonas butyriciproducens]|uniref:N-acetylmuramoyl-L-alanine amidase n=1 Tax=Intestinimonas butyriciproducens TaxID=1297617 RepID=UPI003AF10500
MSKYIAALPLSRVERIAIVVTRGTKTLAQVAAEARSAHPDCEVYVLNGGVYYGAKAVMHLRSDGYTYAEDPYSYWGYAWDVGPDIAMGLVPCGKANYINCVELIRQGTPNPKPRYNPDMGGTRGRTAIGIRNDSLVLYVSGDGTCDARTPEDLRDELAELGCESALMLDGGVSSQCDFNGAKIYSGRKVHNYIVVYVRRESGDKKEDKPVSKTVCLDPGHGVESPGKCSPDKSYYEHEFALDMARRIQAHLERCGVRVVLTRTDEHCPTGKADTNDLLKRVAISDAAGADLFVSIHSNASGNEWSNASGLMIYTSAGPETASRNVAAKAVLSRMTAAGVELRGSPLVHDIELVVTRKTAAPAMLIEYGFHTSRMEVERLKKSSYRAKLAEATAKGVCDFLGVAWEPEAAAGTTDTGAADWAATAWEKAKSKCVLDGTRPTDPVTRQELAVVLDRLNLI